MGRPAAPPKSPLAVIAFIVDEIDEAAERPSSLPIGSAIGTTLASSACGDRRERLGDVASPRGRAGS